MNFKSKSSKNNHYKQAHQGSGHYKRMGIMGDLFDMMISKSRSQGYYDRQNGQSSEELSGLKYMNCIQCGARIPAESKFCLECGNKINKKPDCPTCGERLPENAIFCNNCGTKVK